MIWVEDLPDKQQKPLFFQPSCVDSFFALKYDTKTLLDIFAAAANDFAYACQTVFDETVTSHV